MQSKISKSSQTLVRVCQDVGLPFVKLLRAGQDQGAIFQRIRPLNLPLPRELVEFYESCDGVAANGHTGAEVSVYYGYWILPLQEAIEISLDFRRKGYEEIDKSWFPLLKSGRDYFFVDCGKAERQEPYIVEYMAEAPEKEEVVFQSIQSMLDTFAELYSASAFTVVNGEVSEDNDDLENQIALKHNPQVEYWRNRVLRP